VAFSESPELKALQAQFSTGVRLPELGAVSIVISRLAGIAPPTQDMRRNYRLLLQWFRANWVVVQTWLPLITLRDDRFTPIDQKREIFERDVRRWLEAE
jgi:hypothetical protein